MEGAGIQEEETARRSTHETESERNATTIQLWQPQICDSDFKPRWRQQMADLNQQCRLARPRQPILQALTLMGLGKRISSLGVGLRFRVRFEKSLNNYFSRPWPSYTMGLVKVGSCQAMLVSHSANPWHQSLYQSHCFENGICSLHTGLTS